MERKVGEVTHFFAGPSAAVLRLSDKLKVGDEIHLRGATTDFTETVRSMQIDHNTVENAGPGDDVAILVKDRVREGDEVFVVEADAPGTNAPAGALPVPAAQPPAVRPAQMPSSSASQGAMDTPTKRPVAPSAPAPAAKAKSASKKKTASKKKAAPKKKAATKKPAKKAAKPKAKAKTKVKAKSKAKTKVKKTKAKAKPKTKTKAKKKKR